MSVPYGCLLIDLSPATDDRKRHCTNSGTALLRNFEPVQLKQRKSLDIENIDFLYSPTGLIVFPQVQKRFHQPCPGKFIRFIFESIVNLLKENLQSIKGYHEMRFQKKLSIFLDIASRNPSADLLVFEKVLQLIKVASPPVINHLPCNRAVCSHPCYCV